MSRGAERLASAERVSNKTTKKSEEKLNAYVLLFHNNSHQLVFRRVFQQV
jgi:hypothetical protein